MKHIIFTLSIAIALLTSCKSTNEAPVTEGSKLGYSLEFFKSVANTSKADQNIFVSPYSAAIALSMLKEGADGKTLDELQKALNYCTFTNEQLPSDEFVKIISSNSVWINNNFDINKSYTANLRKNYDADASRLNFADKSAVNTINNWCYEKTNGKINKIISQLTPADAMVLINALYFKGAWALPFPEQATTNDTFKGKTKSSDIKMMHLVKNFDYFSYQGNQIISLPYKNDRYSMIIALPEEGKEFDMNLLNEANFRKVMGMMTNSKVDLRMPKFKLELTCNLIPVMQDMGIKTAFGASADFSKINNDNLYVSGAIQKTFIEVKEEGTEAAAVTSITVSRTSMPRPADAHMIIDHPFVFAIYDKTSENILFAGRIMNL